MNSSCKSEHGLLPQHFISVIQKTQTLVYGMAWYRLLSADQKHLLSVQPKVSANLLQSTRCCHRAGEDLHLLSKEECLGLRSGYPSVPVVEVTQALGHWGSSCSAGNRGEVPGGDVTFAPNTTFTDGLEEDARTTHHESHFTFSPLVSAIIL